MKSTTDHILYSTDRNTNHDSSFLFSDDKNKDGFIDYPEFIAAQQAASAANEK